MKTPNPVLVPTPYCPAQLAVRIRLVRKTLTMIALCAALPIAFAEEASLPDFVGKPDKYVKNKVVGMATGETENAEDVLLIGDRTSAGFKFYFYITGPNGHICSMSGVAKYVSPGRYAVKEACELEILLKGKSARLRDPGGNCKEEACGANAFIDGAEFSLIGSVGAQRLDCDGGSSSDTNRCYAEVWKKTEDQLNKVYQAVVANLKESNRTAGLAALRKEQRAWLKEREKACAMDGGDLNDGWQGTAKATCIADWSSDRTDELREILRKINPGK